MSWSISDLKIEGEKSYHIVHLIYMIHIYKYLEYLEKMSKTTTTKKLHMRFGNFFLWYWAYFCNFTPFFASLPRFGPSTTATSCPECRLFSSYVIYIPYSWKNFYNDGNQKLHKLIRPIFPLILGWFWPFLRRCMSLYVVFGRIMEHYVTPQYLYLYL